MQAIHVLGIFGSEYRNSGEVDRRARPTERLRPSINVGATSMAFLDYNYGRFCMKGTSSKKPKSTWIAPWS